MMHYELRYGSETFHIARLDGEPGAPEVFTAERPGGLVGYGTTEAAAIADYKRTSRDRAWSARDGMCSG